MNILLTGGAGYIGSVVGLFLIDEGHEVTVIDNLITGSDKFIPKKANFLNADIADEEKVSILLKNNKFDLVMHFAGLVNVEESFKFPDKYNLYNVDKAKLFFKYCISSGLNKIIFSSTAGVYGNSFKDKVEENETLNPQSPYSKNKVEIEKYLLDLSNKKKINCAILRYFNVAGADKKNRAGMMSRNSKNIIKAICEFSLDKRLNFLVNGNDYSTKDGTPVRDFIHISDLADIHLVVAKYLKESGKTDIFNCGYGNGFSILEVVTEMEKILNKKLNIKIGKRREGDIPHSVASSEKFKKKFNWIPKHNDLNYILKSSLNWEKII